MFKLYNSNLNISSNLSLFFKRVFPAISKPHLKLIPNILLGLINAESVVTTDIVKKLKGDFYLVSPNSSIRRLERFFNNPRFLAYDFFAAIISHVINYYNFKNHNVYISFDHSYCKNSFTTFMLSLRIGKQGIPIWFRCIKGYSV